MMAVNLLAAGFVSSWGVFGVMYGLAIVLAAGLGLIGVVVVAQRQVFLGAAVGQATALGYALALWLGAAMGAGVDSFFAGDVFRGLLALGMAVVAALGMTWAQRGQRNGSRLAGDEVTAWVFAGAAALSILLLADLPQGMEQLQRVLGASLLGATKLDLALACVFTVACAVPVVMGLRKLVLVLSDRVMASAVGVNVALWDWGVAVLIALGLGLAITATGMVFAFACLVLPALIAKQVVRTVGGLVVWSPVVAVGFTLVGLWASYIADTPPGQTVAALLAGGLVGAIALRETAGRLGLA